jgi:acyl-CoA synthetase (AMP-forming)/AMP-acid ligase II
MTSAPTDKSRMGGQAPLWELHHPAPELAAAWREAGLWRREPLPLGQLVDDSLQKFADRPFTFRSEYRPWKGTYGAVRELALRAAEGLHTDYLSHLDEIRADLPRLESVIVVGDGPHPAGTESFSALLDTPALTAPAWGDPTAPVVIAYTSGTTSDPKGVIHSDVTLMAEMGHQTTMRGAGGRVDRPSLVGAPLGHAGGMYSSLLTPLPAGLPIHLIDKWDPEAVLRAMLEDGLSSGGGVTFFLTSLLDHPDCTPAHHALIGRAGMGGAAVPPAVSDRAEQLGIDIFRPTAPPSTPRSPAAGVTRRRPSASTPTAAPCRGWTSAWSTTTVAT